MDNRPAHLETDYKHELSPRQREVLALVARGKTYGEIADALGITLDGVKWHMREVLTKLGVNSREEAADWWRQEHSLSGRFSRLARALAPLAGVRVVLAGAAMTAVAGVAIAGTMLAWWTLPGQAQESAPVVDGGGSLNGCATTDALLSGGATDVQNNEYELISAGAGGFRALREPGVSPNCVVEDDMRLELTLSGKPLDVEGNGLWFHVDADYRTGAKPGAGASTIMLKWTNWCGVPGTAEAILSADHYQTQNFRASTPKCLDRSQPSRLSVLYTEP